MQKKLRTLGLVLLAFTLTTAVGVSVNTETASAKKVNAKTLKLKKKKLSMKVGDKKTLKVTVKPKNAKLKWKSNKKKIATVSKKGVVKGKKKGTAKITVTSGKKKATCKVTVKQAYNIKSVEVINSKVVRVTLNKAKKLTVKNFAVKKKASSEAKNMKKLTVASVNNSKNKVYDLILSTNYDSEYDDNVINDEDYVSVTIKKLNGVKTKETIYYASAVPSNEYIGGKTGEIINKDVYFNSSYRGYLSSVKVAGLPAGLKAEIHNHFVTIKGIPTAVANGTQATITAKDELGKALTQKVLFYIGSDTQIVSYIPTEGRTILANDGYTKAFRIRAYGGSGNYQYSLVNNTNKFISGNIDGNAYISFTSAMMNEAGKKEYLPAGKYNVTYSIADKGNAAITANGSLDVTAVNGVKISGNVVAGDNTPVAYANVSARFKDVNHTFFENELETNTVSEDYTDAGTGVKHTKGSYELVLYPSQAYTLNVSAGGAETGVVNFNPGNANQVRNFTLPIYKVTLAAQGVDLAKCSFGIEGVDGNGYKSYGSADAYLKKGTYMVNTTTEVSTQPDPFTTVSTTYKLTGTFTVSGNMAVNLTVAKVSEQTESEISPDSLQKDIYTYAEDDLYYKFTPSANGKYAIACDSSLQAVTVYNMDGSMVGIYSATAVDENSYQCVTGELKANTQYLFKFVMYGSVKVSDYTELPAPTE